MLSFAREIVWLLVFSCLHFVGSLRLWLLQVGGSPEVASRFAITRTPQLNVLLSHSLFTQVTLSRVGSPIERTLKRDFGNKREGNGSELASVQHRTGALQPEKEKS